MPRRPTETEDGIPLFLVPHVVMKGIHKYGEEVEWAEIRRTSRHFYSVRIRTRSVKREFRVRARAERSPGRIAVCDHGGNGCAK